MNWVRCLGLIIILCIGAFFAYRAIQHSSVKDFWGDETFGLQGTARGESYQELLSSGARGQGSRAPLDYIFIKSLDSVYKPFFENIPPNVYYRLNSIFWDFLAGILVAVLSLLALDREKSHPGVLGAQVFLICYALIVFYFKRDNMHFATEMRPYALWNSLWYVMLGCVMLRLPAIWLFLAGILLALTSSGALLQIPSLALAQAIIRLVNRDNLSSIPRDTISIYLVPFLIALFYTMHAEKFTYVKSALDYQHYSHEFLLFWISKWRTAVLSVAGIFLTIWHRRGQGCAIVFLSLLLLYGAAPAINSKILSTGFFFTSRQYLYFDLIFPIFIYTVGLVLPEYLNTITKKGKL